LLVDDDPAVIRALWRTLRALPIAYQVNAASSTFQALSAIAELRYDVVITDLQMPGGGGVAVLEELALHHPETARVVHSSQLESGDAARVRALAHVVLAKPASETQLIEALDSALARVAARRQDQG
jgi:DNA-binding NarL/FixJ family response regulator